MTIYGHELTDILFLIKPVHSELKLPYGLWTWDTHFVFDKKHVHSGLKWQYMDVGHTKPLLGSGIHRFKKEQEYVLAAGKPFFWLDALWWQMFCLADWLEESVCQGKYSRPLFKLPIGQRPDLILGKEWVIERSIRDGPPGYKTTASYDAKCITSHAEILKYLTTHIEHKKQLRIVLIVSQTTIK